MEAPKQHCHEQKIMNGCHANNIRQSSEWL